MTVMLTARQKAAVIVRLLLQEDGGDLSLEALPVSAQDALTRELAGMGMIDRATRDAVVSEFCDTLEQVGVTFPEGLDRALDLLGGRISPDCADRLRRMAALSGDGDPWDRLVALPVGQVVALAGAEAVEMSAVLFARLPPAKAAEAFGRLPPDRARRIAYAMSMTAGIEAAALTRIGLALMQAADALPRPALSGGPVEKVGAILNHAPAATRDGVLEGLDEDDRDFAQDVRRAIFTWANIPQRIEARDVPRVLKAVDQASLVRALAASTGALEGVARFVMASISQRMGEALRDEIEGLGRLNARDAEAAMAAVIATIREMEAAGDLVLIPPGEEGEEGAPAAVPT